ncbi:MULTISPECIES: glycogen synthase GlgA [Achromobacter]|uniref:Glycogen synthase n=1 Tax=Achromobacter piechaudii TaxID=72556 RepID=A0ABN7EY56_9BURK|nr:glycogen synthase GlgA [Achromobacter piechaudii]MPS77744.1 glycogen synthase GlgA [Achromobacter sp.]CAB3683828.1 Glycogen synthase [Achromobacter piechaudii]CAB3869064.1 Glycogen synthase [Achromobacter piechaudii]CAB3948288.1 Glycogen synthase [Achromobacter piechaudii]
MATTILIVAAEAFPLAKTGGLGDAITGMTRAMVQRGIPATVLLPAYRGAAKQLDGVREVARLEDLPGGDARLLAGVCPTSELPFLLLENDALYDRAGLYVDEDGQEHPDNGLRYAALSHAAVRIARGLPGLPRPDVVHAHDWHAALTPMLLRDAGLTDVKSILTIHNMAFQGQFPLEDAAAYGIPPAYRGEHAVVAWDKLNFMKAGIAHADRVTTVSHTYAREILTPQFGCGLDGLLRERAADLIAIPNGIDTALWDPSRDPHLGQLRYGSGDLANKRLCKTALQREFGLLPDAQATLVVMGSRLTEQKMADVAAEALPRALDAHPEMQVAILGQGDRRLENALKALAERYPERFATRIGYNEAAAHRLHAGGDILLHGSRFEPFGLTPLYAMRYGTVPIGSRVGGMADTIEDPGSDSPLTAMAFANGLLFDGDHPDAMANALDRAMHLRQHPMLWRAMQRNAMSTDFSWQRAVGAYEDLLQALTGRTQADQIVEEPASARSADTRQRRTRQARGSMPMPI